MSAATLIRHQPLSALLTSVRARAVVVLDDLYRGDWAIDVPSSDQLAELSQASTHDVVAAFHIIQRGSAAVAQPAHTWDLAEGDVFIALQPDGHLLTSPRYAVVPTPLVHLLSSIPPPPRAADPVAAGDTLVLCGVFVVELPAWSPLRRFLRTNLHLRAAERRHSPMITGALARPAEADDPTWQFATSRLLEVLLFEALTSNEANAPFASAIDDFVARSATLIDSDPAEQWTVERLAHACAVSPSWLCERFRSALGTTPMRYLFERRMTLAADLLLHSTDSVERIGHHVGFANQPAFTRAFKRHFGSPPSEWRTMRRQTADRRGPAH